METAPEASIDDLQGMLDSLQHRVNGDLSAGEFVRIFARWGQAHRGSAASKPDSVTSPSRNKSISRVSKAVFCTEIGSRELSERNLALIFATVVNERNRSLLAVTKAFPEQAQKMRMRLALCEKVFFCLDREGRGFITADDALGLVFTQQVDAWERLSGKDPSKFRAKMSVQNLQDLGMRTLRVLANNQTRDGVLTLGQFKEHCLQLAESGASTSTQFARRRPSANGNMAPTLTLDDMGLHKLLVTLNSHEDVFAEVSSCWVHVVNREIEEKESQDGTSIALARFLCVQGPRIRLERYAPAHEWGSTEDINLLWKGFARGSSARSQPHWFKLIERVVDSFKSSLNKLIIRYFGEAPQTELTGVSTEYSPRPSSQSILKSRKPSGTLYGHSSNELNSRTNEGRPSVGSVSDHVARYMIDLEALDEANNANGKHVPYSKAESNVSGRTDGVSALDKMSTDAYQGEGLYSGNPFDSSFAPSPQSPGRTVHQQDGAHMIKGYRLFEAEKTKLFGFSPSQVSTLWDGLSHDDKQVYIDMSRAASSPNDHDRGVQSKSRRNSSSTGSSAYDDGNGDSSQIVIVQMPAQDKSLLRSRLRERAMILPSNLANAVWTPLSIDVAIEHMLAAKFALGSISGSPGQKDIDSFPNADSTEELLSRRGISPRRSESTIREGILRTQPFGTTGSRELYVKLCLGAQPGASELSMSSSNGHSNQGSVRLHGSTVARILQRSAHGLVVRTSERSYKFFAEERDEIDAWHADICFVIAAAASGERSNSSPLGSSFPFGPPTVSSSFSRDGIEPSQSWVQKKNASSAPPSQYNPRMSPSTMRSASPLYNGQHESGDFNPLRLSPLENMDQRYSSGIDDSRFSRPTQRSPSSSFMSPGFQPNGNVARSAVTPVTQYGEYEEQDERLRQLENAAKLLRHAAEGMNTTVFPQRRSPQPPSGMAGRPRTGTDDNYPTVPSRRPPTNPRSSLDGNDYQTRNGNLGSLEDEEDSFEDCAED